MNYYGEYLYDSDDDDMKKSDFIWNVWNFRENTEIWLDCDYTDNHDNKGRILKHKNCEYTSMKYISIWI